jgi:hypothetical protein
MRAWKFWLSYLLGVCLAYYHENGNLYVPLGGALLVALGQLVYRVFTRHQRREEREHQLYAALWMARDVQPGLSGIQLADMAGLSSMIYADLWRLQERGWVERAPIGPRLPNGGRPYYYQLTELGVRALEALLLPNLREHQRLAPAELRTASALAGQSDDRHSTDPWVDSSFLAISTIVALLAAASHLVKRCVQIVNKVLPGI